MSILEPHTSVQNARAAPYLKGLRGQKSEINLKNTGIFSLNALQSLGYFNTGCPFTQSSYFMYASIGYNVMFHGNSTLKCAEVVQPQMIDQAKYGNLSLVIIPFKPSCWAHLQVLHIPVSFTYAAI